MGHHLDELLGVPDLDEADRNQEKDINNSLDAAFLSVDVPQQEHPAATDLLHEILAPSDFNFLDNLIIDPSEAQHNTSDRKPQNLHDAQILLGVNTSQGHARAGCRPAQHVTTNGQDQNTIEELSIRNQQESLEKQMDARRSRETTTEKGSCSSNIPIIRCHFVSKCVKEAMDMFFDYAQIIMGYPINIQNDEDSYGQVGCTYGALPSIQRTDDICAREFISSCLEKEFLAGRCVNRRFVNVWARKFLSVLNFEFMCPSCGCFFKKQDEFRNHLYRTGGGRVVCPFLCPYRSWHSNEIIDHINHTHLGPTCHVHRARHLSFRCQEYNCRESFETMKGLIDHYQSVHERQPRHCSMCKNYFRNMEDLLIHNTEDHGITERNEEMMFRCRVSGCNFRCAVEHLRRKHHNLHHRRLPYDS